MKLFKFIAIYYGVKPRDCDGLDFYTLDENQLELFGYAFMECKQDPQRLAELVADAKLKRIIKQDETVK